MCQIVRATDDDQDLEQDANLTDATYCGHPEFLGGVVDGMGGFYSNRAGNGQGQIYLHSGVSVSFRGGIPVGGQWRCGSLSV